jgi:Zn-dependent alcohol dehydrogenase
MDREPSFGLSEIAGDYESGGDYCHSTLGVTSDGRYSESFTECLNEHEASGVVEVVGGRFGGSLPRDGPPTL